MWKYKKIHHNSINIQYHIYYNLNLAVILYVLFAKKKKDLYILIDLIFKFGN